MQSITVKVWCSAQTSDFVIKPKDPVLIVDPAVVLQKLSPILMISEVGWDFPTSYLGWNLKLDVVHSPAYSVHGFFQRSFIRHDCIHVRCQLI